MKRTTFKWLLLLFKILVSTRKLNNELEISQMSVSRILCKNTFHLYDIQLVQKINDRLQSHIAVL